MDDLTFEAEPLHPCGYCRAPSPPIESEPNELDSSDGEYELSAEDDSQLARSVVQALARVGIRDTALLTNVAFFIHHPERAFRKIDPAKEPGLAREWMALKASLVSSALATGQGGASAPAVGTSAGTKVLLVGDSHTYGEFGKELARLLEARGATVVRRAKIGTAVKYWLPRVPALLSEHTPTLVIVALGANMRGYPSARGTSAQIRKLVDLIRRDRPKARIVWIGPPRQRSDTEATLQRFNTIVRAGLDQQTVFVDSAPHTPTYEGRDGVHYADEPARRWARGVFKEIAP